MEQQTGRAEAKIGIVAPAICVLIAILEGYDLQAFGIAAGRVAAELKMDAGAIGIAASVAMVGLMIGATVGGVLSGRVGPKRVLLWSVCLFALCSLLTAFSQSFAMLVVARLLTGLGFGGAMPNLLAVATRLRPGGKHAAMSTLIFCGMPTGAILTALVAQYVLPSPLPWRTLFALGGILPLALAPLAAWLLPAFGPLPKQAAAQSVTTTLFGEGRALSTILLWVSFFCALLLLYLMINWLPLLVVGKGFAPATGVSATLTFNLCGISFALLLAWWATSVGMRIPLVVATTVLIAGTLGMLAVNSEGLILVTAGLIGAGAASLQYLLYAAAPMPYPQLQSIAAAGAVIGTGRLGSIVGPYLAGVLRQSGFSVNALLAMLVPVALVSGLCGLLALLASRTGKAP